MLSNRHAGRAKRKRRDCGLREVEVFAEWCDSVFRVGSEGIRD
jgi:hypothetical protein